MNVYTTIGNLKSNNNISYHSYTELGDMFADWIETNMYSLMSKHTKWEKILADKLQETCFKTYEQAFFMINGKSYFLDFFIPEYNVAIELDGSSHNSRKETDKERDEAFKSIGIKTFRYNNSDILEVHFINNLFKRLESCKEKMYKSMKQKSVGEFTYMTCTSGGVNVFDPNGIMIKHCSSKKEARQFAKLKNTEQISRLVF